MADWAGGYTATWRVSRVNQETWSDSEDVPDVVRETLKISRRSDSDVPLLEEGSMSVDAPWDGEAWCRITMTADGSERVPVSTVLCQSASRQTARGTVSDVDAWSVLKPADDTKLTHGAYAPQGCDGAEEAARLIRACTPAPVVVEGSFTISDHVVFDLGASHLDGAWQLLRAGDFCIQIDGDGTIHVRPMPDSPSLVIDRTTADIVSVAGVDESYDLSNVPNRYTAVDGSQVEVATNEDPSSPVSYRSRGRWVDVVDTSPVRVNGETLAAYARRRLREMSVVRREVTYNREFWPDVVPFSVVRCSMPEHGLDGDLRVSSQALTLGKGITVRETAYREESLL